MTEKKEELTVNLQSFRKFDSFRMALNDYVGEVVIVEFACGKFLKKALGCMADVGSDFVKLNAPRRDWVNVDIFFPSGTSITEQAAEVIIPLDKVCAVELLSESHCSGDRDRRRPFPPFDNNNEDE